MKGNEEVLLDFMEGGRKRFIIPVYQRNYDWELENCKQLYDDLVRVIRNNLKSHFFGCIVSQSNPDGNINEVLIIDGQQRLTTVSLLLLAIHDSIRDGVVIPQDDGLADTVFEDYLIVKRDPSRTKLKLKPIKSDENAFNGLFGISPDRVEDSSMTLNYNYFRNRISKGEVTIDELFRAVGQLQIINIGLGADDSPQLIFESLNSKGMSLSQGDLIRNYILMDAPAREQERLYDRFWNPIEANTGYDVTAFIRYYLGVKTRQSPIEEKLYSAFKRYVEERPVTKDSLLQEMLDYSHRYGILLRGGTKVPSVDGAIARLNRLDATVVRPFLLEVLRRCDDGELTWDDVAMIMTITEEYIFRRNICELPTNKLKNIFLNMDKDIVRLDGNPDRYIDKFMFILLSKTDNSRFPDQIEFIDAFLNREVYKMNGRVKSYIFERLENQGTREDKDVYRHIDDGTYSIEHVMPQHLNQGWIEDLGDDYETIHDEWLHRIANLTLTAYNSQLSNGTFDQKLNGENGFLQSGIRMNQWICRRDRWTLDELEERNDLLGERASEIWPMITTSYVPPEVQMDSFTLDQEVDSTHRKPVRFEYGGTEHTVRNWTDVYVSVLRELHGVNPNVLNHLASVSDGSEDLSNHVVRDPEGMEKYAEIDDGIYVWVASTSDYKLVLLRRFFALYGADTSDLTVYLDSSASSDSDSMATKEMHRRYWEVALPMIREAVGKGPFSNVSPSKDNWISGYFGVSGIYISCVFTSHSARVELYFRRDPHEESLRAFDNVEMHRSEIEAELGTELFWKRDYTARASRIHIQVKGIDTRDESNWADIASFHAEWVARFNRLLVPYVVETFQAGSRPGN